MQKRKKQKTMNNKSKRHLWPLSRGHHKYRGTNDVSGVYQYKIKNTDISLTLLKRKKKDNLPINSNKIHIIYIRMKIQT